VTDYTLVIILTLVGFIALAAILLVPVYRFLKREERESKQWSREELPPDKPVRSPNGEEPS
jgi:membrane protein implicated in regulation of membrane protease activity